MRIQTWRLVLTGAAVTVLAVASISLVAGTTTPQAPASNVVTARPPNRRVPAASRTERTPSASARSASGSVPRGSSGSGGTSCTPRSRSSAGMTS